MTLIKERPSLSPVERRATLEAFSRAMEREAHNLQRWPDLLWQQLYNRLQWEEEPVPQVLAPELARRTVPGGAAAGRGRRQRNIAAVSGRTGLALLASSGTPAIQFCCSPGEGYGGGVL